MKFVEIERNSLGLKTSSSRVLRGTKCPQKVPRHAIRPKKSVEISPNVPYCKAVCIRGGAPKFGRPPKISSERVLYPHKNGAKRPFLEKHVRRPLAARSTGPSGVLLAGVSVRIQGT